MHSKKTGNEYNLQKELQRNERHWTPLKPPYFKSFNTQIKLLVWDYKSSWWMHENKGS